MIKVTQLNGEILYLNYFQIEYIETIPETKIKLVGGNYYLVKDTAESVGEQIKAFLAACISGTGLLERQRFCE